MPITATKHAFVNAEAARIPEGAGAKLVDEQVARYESTVDGLKEPFGAIDADGGLNHHGKTERKRTLAIDAARRAMEADAKIIDGIERRRGTTLKGALESALGGARVDAADRGEFRDYVSSLGDEKLTEFRIKSDRLLDRTTTPAEATMIALAGEGVAEVVKVVDAATPLYHRLLGIGDDARRLARIELARAIRPEAMAAFDQWGMVQRTFDANQARFVSAVGSMAGTNHLREIVRADGGEA